MIDIIGLLIQLHPESWLRVCQWTQSKSRAIIDERQYQLYLEYNGYEYRKGWDMDLDAKPEDVEVMTKSEFKLAYADQYSIWTSRAQEDAYTYGTFLEQAGPEGLLPFGQMARYLRFDGPYKKYLTFNDWKRTHSEANWTREMFEDDYITEIPLERATWTISRYPKGIGYGIMAQRFKLHRVDEYVMFRFSLFEDSFSYKDFLKEDPSKVKAFIDEFKEELMLMASSAMIGEYPEPCIPLYADWCLELTA